MFSFVSFYLLILDWMNSRLVTQLVFVDDCYFPRDLLLTLHCMFCLELPEHHLVTGIKPFGLLEVFVQQRVSDREKLSALTWKLWVYERGSDLTCKTNSTLPSFVKS